MFGLAAGPTTWSSLFASGSAPAKPWARLAQASRPRAGPCSAAARIRATYAARVDALRAAMRAVTDAVVGFTVCLGSLVVRPLRSQVVLLPGAAVPLDEGDGGGGAGRARGLPLRRQPGLRPMPDDRVAPRPRGLDLVAAHEQGRVALDDVHE